MGGTGKNPFEAITAVHSGPIPRAALRTDAVDPKVIGDAMANGSGEIAPVAPVAPVARESRPLSRAWHYAMVASSFACLATTIGVVVWARGEVRSARAAAAAPRADVIAISAAANARHTTPAPAAAVKLPVAAAAAQPCTVFVTASVADATVWLDGAPLGAVPALAVVDCGREAMIEVRHPRYETLERSFVGEAGTVRVDARLEKSRKKRRK